MTSSTNLTDAGRAVVRTSTLGTLPWVLAADRPALVLVDLDHADWETPIPSGLRRNPGIVVGRSSRPLPASSRPWLEALTLTLAPDGPGRTWVNAPLEPIMSAVETSPRAAAVLATLLPVTRRADVADGLVTESLAYSMLLGGAEFRAWRQATPLRVVDDVADPVLVSRDGERLEIRLNRPERHNAFGRAVRNGLLEALEIAELDRSITSVRLSGAGRSFCSGGDLDEFGQADDTAVAHVVRLSASVGAAVHRLRGIMRPELHGACVGAGIEVPAFADHVVATPDAWFQLPELRFGLVPGAGGTVSVTRRIGPWRTAWMCLTGARIDAPTAVEWGLVDAIAGD